MSLAVAAMVLGPDMQLQSLVPLPSPQAPMALESPQLSTPPTGLNRSDLHAHLQKKFKEVEKQMSKKLDAKIELALQQRVPPSSKSERAESAVLEKVESLIDSKMEALVTAMEGRIEKDMWVSLDRQMDKKLDNRVIAKIEKAIKKGSFDAAAPLQRVDKSHVATEALAQPAPTDLEPIDRPSAADLEMEEEAHRRPVDVVSTIEQDAATGDACKATDVTGAPKDWCGRTEKKPCMDNWESQYMMKNANKLNEGLQTIRSPSCFPRGKSIAAMGYYRTGSTLLYNVARLWAALGAGGSLTSGFMCKDPEKLGIGVPGAKAEKCTSVCKDHTWHTGNPEHTDIILMSRRDPYMSVCSRKLMGQWCKKPPEDGQKDTPEEVEKYAKACKTTSQMERIEAVSQCHELMKMQAAIYYERVILDKTIAYDVLVEDFEENPHREVSAVGRAMGICHKAANNSELVRFVVEMGRQLKKNPSADMGITQMHDVHTTSQRDRDCADLKEFMKGDEECRAWMDAKAAVSANAELEKMKTTPPKRQRLGNAQAKAPSHK